MDNQTAGVDLDKPGAHHLTPENIAATIKDLREIEEGNSLGISDPYDKARANLVAYIDGRTAGVAPELYTCIGKGGEYEHIGVAAGAGVTRGNLVHVYRDRANGKLFYRTPMDFDARMERIAAAPTPMNSGKGEA
jgi:hypothetical protein